MLIEVGVFCRRVERDLRSLVSDLQQVTEREGEEEARAWEASLPRLADVLRHDALKQLHLHLERRGKLSLEYRLPASSSWADTVLLGRGDTAPVAVVVELKNWVLDGDSPGPREGLVFHQGQLTLHPADQVRGYVEYCRKFHGAIGEARADVAGCVFFTAAPDADVYGASPHDRLVAEYPFFTRNRRDMTDRFPAYLSNLLREPDPGFAEAFEDGTYKQDRSFVAQVAAVISDPSASPFVLLDAQRKGFEYCMATIDRVLERAGPGEKAVVLIEGPPGSGKSVLAAQLWATLARDRRITGNAVLVTTSGAQRNNWEHLFERSAGQRAGRGLVKPANSFNPGLSPKWTNEMRRIGRKVEIETWTDNLALFKRSGRKSRCPDDSFDVSIVDEAHALIDPTAPNARGVSPSGWAMHAGPQAFHVIRASRVSVFLLDGAQSFRDNETTTQKRIADLARDLGVPKIECLSLGASQFRCGGSTEYLTWLEALIDHAPSETPPLDWQRRRRGPFGFEIVSGLGELDRRLREHLETGRSARLGATYSRPWKTKDDPDPHNRRPEDMDFCIPYQSDGRPQVWSRVWNFTPRGDYTYFVQAPPGSPMAANPLGEVGCTYVLRGFDYDYLGILWMSDYVRRGNRWVAQPEHVHESAWTKLRKAVREERRPGPKMQELERRLARAYRILLSRAIRGIYVWFEDEETRAYVSSRLE